MCYNNITHHIQPHRRQKGWGLMMRRVGMRVERVMRMVGKKEQMVAGDQG